MFTSAAKQAAIKAELEETYNTFPTAARIDAGTLAAIEALGLTFNFDTQKIEPLDEEARYRLKMYS